MTLVLAGAMLGRSLIPMADAWPPDMLWARVTFYTLGGRMANTDLVHRGAAACSRFIPMGTLLRLPDDRVVECDDRGDGDSYWNPKTGYDGWIDIWEPNRAVGLQEVEANYGTGGVVLLVDRWGTDSGSVGLNSARTTPGT